MEFKIDEEYRKAAQELIDNPGDNLRITVEIDRVAIDKSDMEKVEEICEVEMDPIAAFAYRIIEVYKRLKKEKK